MAYNGNTQGQTDNNKTQGQLKTRKTKDNNTRITSINKQIMKTQWIKIIQNITIKLQ